MLAAMTADPSRPLSSVDLLDGTALERLDMWANRAVLTGQSATPQSIPAVFAAQVAQRPDAVALTFQDRAMTYRELDDASNRLAHLLADHGARPGGVWCCCCRARPRRSWRFWRCSKRGRLSAHRPRASGRADRAPAR
ncbi:putative linear gramicidin synthetase subunit D [Mycobacterium xenopi 3993]|nr:putative linear gramicidin synthetase subunit D [Mycobacterium xenopi 3993]